MTNLERLFASRETGGASDAGVMPRPYAESNIAVISQSATRVIDVINESIAIAKSSPNAETKLSRLGVAYRNLRTVKRMACEYPFLLLNSLGEVEAEMEALAFEFIRKGYQELAAGNLRGESLERAGRMDEAVAAYEALVASATDTPFTYRRLAIIYRKKRDLANELRVLRAALQNVPKGNVQHYAWFEDRLGKRSASSRP